jgi:hypothetical protein
MNPDFSNLELDTLKAMYKRENADLAAMLIDGTPWNEMKEQRNKVTQISIALHQKFELLGQNPTDLFFDAEER